MNHTTRVIKNKVTVTYSDNGAVSRRVISPLDDYSNEPQDIIDLCDQVFTQQVKAQYSSVLQAEESARANRPAPPLSGNAKRIADLEQQLADLSARVAALETI